MVLTDLVLGNNNGGGIDVLEMAKRKDPFIMVILFTAQEKNLDRFEAYKHGAFDCIEKNILGGRAWQEISVKANAAINFRQLAKAQVADQKQLANLQRFLDPRVDLNGDMVIDQNDMTAIRQAQPAYHQRSPYSRGKRIWGSAPTYFSREHMI